MAHAVPTEPAPRANPAESAACYYAGGEHVTGCLQRGRLDELRMLGKRAAPKYRAVCAECRNWLLAERLARLYSFPLSSFCGEALYAGWVQAEKPIGRVAADTEAGEATRVSVVTCKRAPPLCGGVALDLLEQGRGMELKPAAAVPAPPLDPAVPAAAVMAVSGRQLTKSWAQKAWDSWVTPSLSKPLSVGLLFGRAEVNRRAIAVGRLLFGRCLPSDATSAIVSFRYGFDFGAVTGLVESASLTDLRDEWAIIERCGARPWNGGRAGIGHRHY